MAQNPSIGREILPIPDLPVRAEPALHAKDASAPPITPLRPPKGAPNVLIVLIDDMGFGATSAFGGPCEMPTFERLADGGLTYNRFHTTALCSPTRQALLTGRNHHSAEMGSVGEVATSMPGNTSVRPNTVATVAEMLRLNGYSTAAFGKMHQTPVWETSVAGPFDRWPTGDGFEKFWGFVAGETNQWEPTLYEGTTPTEPRATAEEGYHITEEQADQAIAWITAQKTMTPDKPFFAYMSYGATHAPHHAPKEWIEKYRGKFDKGWDAVRAETLANQNVLGGEISEIERAVTAALLLDVRLRGRGSRFSARGDARYQLQGTRLPETAAKAEVALREGARSLEKETGTQLLAWLQSLGARALESLVRVYLEREGYTLISSLPPSRGVGKLVVEDAEGDEEGRLLCVVIPRKTSIDVKSWEGESERNTCNGHLFFAMGDVSDELDGRTIGVNEMAAWMTRNRIGVQTMTLEVPVLDATFIESVAGLDT